MKEEIDINGLFLGPKSENGDFFKKLVMDTINEHLFWRKDFHPEDDPIVSLYEKNEKNFILTEEKITQVIEKICAKLKETSMPWHSPRYLGHMNSDILMPAMLGYIAAMLYNPNNVAFEASTATSPMELEVGKDFAALMGYDVDKAWGHICTDGSIANLEAIWYARNLTSIPFAVAELRPELVKGKTHWQLANMTVDEILDLSAQVKDIWNEVRDRSIRGTGVVQKQLGKWIVPQTKHYSWVKAGEVIGLGLNNVISIQVDNNYRMDIDLLEKTIKELADSKTPILGVVAVVGTTEEGAVDHVDRIVALRKEMETQGVSFYLHIDAAYGGYARSIFLDENGSFIPFDDLTDRLHEDGVINQDVIQWPSIEVYEAFKAISESDSVTIDPHKMGYVPYAAGGITIRDRRMVDAISFFAAYVFEKGTQSPALLGSYILEGSKAGATAAAVWAAHQVLPLNITGYGRLIGASIEGAQKFYDHIQKNSTLDVNGTKVRLEALTKPDFNMVDFAFNVEGNKDLEKMNQLNLDLYNLSSYVSGPVFRNDFITSHTEFTYDDYGYAPEDMVERLGIDSAEWDRVHSFRLMRACVLTPYFMTYKSTKHYWETYLDSMKHKLEQIL